MMDEYLKTTSNPFKIGRHLRKTQQSSPFLITDYNQKIAIISKLHPIFL